MQNIYIIQSSLITKLWEILLLWYQAITQINNSEKEESEERIIWKKMKIKKKKNKKWHREGKRLTYENLN